MDKSITQRKYFVPLWLGGIAAALLTVSFYLWNHSFTNKSITPNSLEAARKSSDLDSASTTTTKSLLSGLDNKAIDKPDMLRALSERSEFIAERVRPSIVKVFVSRNSGASKDKESESFFGQIPLEKNDDIGSGFFIRADGWVLTDYHVVRNSDSIRVEDSNGVAWAAVLKGYDSVSDLAVLKVEVDGHGFLPWGNSSTVRAGQFVWIAGAPFGLEASISFGIVSSTGRSLMNGSALRDYIQTDAVINPGSSGSPVLDIEGNVIGIASAILGEDFRGIGFALPEQIANPVAKQLIESGKVNRGWIGAQLGQVTSERARKVGLESARGAYVEWLEAGDTDRIPAKKAGMLPGDICIECNGEKIISPFDLARKIAFTPPGEVLVLSVRRESKILSLKVLVASKQ